MNRRTDDNTAEKIRMALLTRVAFTRPAAQQYAKIAGVPEPLIVEVLERAVNQVRQYDYLSHSNHQADRRSFSRD